MATQSVNFKIKAIDDASNILKKVQLNLDIFKKVIGSVAAFIQSVFKTVLDVVKNVARAVEDQVKTLVKSMVGLAASFEQARMAYKNMLGGEAAADEFLATIRKFAEVTPFELPQLIETGRIMLSYGFAVKEIIPIMTAIGDTVAAMGGSAEMMERVTTSIGQIKNRGFLSGMEAMSLSRAGVNVYRYLSEYLGITIPEAMKKTFAGTVDSATALEALMFGMNQRFGGMMMEQARTLKGTFENLRDVFEGGLTSIGSALIPTLTAIVRGIMDLLERVFSKKNVETVQQWIGHIFSRENIQKIVTWFANIYVISKSFFERLLANAPEIFDKMILKLREFRDVMLDTVIPTVIKMGQILTTVLAVHTGLSVIRGTFDIGGAVARSGIPYAGTIGGGIAAFGLATGTAIAAGGSIYAHLGADKMSKKFDDWMRETMNPIREREKMMTPTQALADRWGFGGVAQTQEAQDIVNTFMEGFDGMTSAQVEQNKLLGGIQANTDTLVAQGNEVLAYGNTSERMEQIAARARFGAMGREPGGVQVNITVADMASANQLRYALEYLAAGR